MCNCDYYYGDEDRDYQASEDEWDEPIELPNGMIIDPFVGEYDPYKIGDWECGPPPKKVKRATTATTTTRAGTTAKAVTKATTTKAKAATTATAGRGRSATTSASTTSTTGRGNKPGFTSRPGAQSFTLGQGTKAGSNSTAQKRARVASVADVSGDPVDEPPPAKRSSASVSTTPFRKKKAVEKVEMAGSAPSSTPTTLKRAVGPAPSTSPTKTSKPPAASSAPPSSTKRKTASGPRKK